jgi:hypothetical protein
MIHPFKSIIARRQGYILNNFEKSKYSKKLSGLKDIYKGERCFIVANGPSLNAKDLDLLHSKNEYTFGMNRIYKIFNQTKWRPSFYVCEDINIFNDCVNEINDIQTDIKFIPLDHHFYSGINIDNAYYFNPNYDRNADFPNSFSTDISKQIDLLGTVTYTCMEIAVYMGFSEIYLLGVDHNYHVTIDEEGNKIIDNNVKDYFCEDYDNDIKDVVAHNMWNNTIAYKKAKTACDELGVKIFNATRGGKLEVFPRVNFDSLLMGDNK